MNALVTGGTGFIGSHVVRALLDDGASVRCLVRPSSKRVRLDGLDVEIAVGDLDDPSSVREAVRDAEVVFHCAADYRLYVPDPATMYRVNVEGTRNVLEAAASSGVARVVHTSSVGALGLRDGGAPADETTPAELGQMIGPYKRTKFLAERVAEEWAARGLPVVVVHPSTPVGEGDVKPTATGRIIVDFLNRRFPVYVDTGLNIVDVRDVARGHILAARRGRVGDKYILGHRNMTLKELLDTLSEITGLAAPRFRAPHWLAVVAAVVETSSSRITGREPRVPLDGVRMARHRMFFDSSKAVRELGLPQTPVEQALDRAVRWFREQGYCAASGGR